MPYFNGTFVVFNSWRDKGEKINTKMCPYGHVSMLVCREWEAAKQMGTVFGVWSDGREAAKHENTHGGLVFSRGGAEGAPNTQNVPYRHFVCVGRRESTPTAQTCLCGCISTVGVKEEGQEMPPTWKTRLDRH